METEELLERLSEKGCCLILLKANRGYSGIIMERGDYTAFVGRDHFNGETVKDVMQEIIEKGGL